MGCLRALLSSMVAQASIEPRPVYATGLLNGGAMSHRLVGHAPDVFDAVAPFA